MEPLASFSHVDLTHRTVMSTGNRIHLVEVGEGPLVVLVHGFPESWYSWRHQLGPLARAGYRVVAIDVRGYGRSSAPLDIADYSMTVLVGDLIAVLDDFEVETAVLIGHDWGAPIVWNTALLRPDRVSGVAGLSVPYNPRGDVEPLGALRALAGEDHLFYIDYFQQPGLAEAEAERDLAGWLRGFYHGASAEADPATPMALVPKDGHIRDVMSSPSPGAMKWMSEADFAFYLGEFERSGLTGGLNRYRCLSRDWVELAPWRFAPITAPSLFIGGDRDGPTIWGANAIDHFDRNLPNLVGCHILDNCGHWVQQEQPELTTSLLVDFCDSVHRR